VVFKKIYNELPPFFMHILETAAIHNTMDYIEIPDEERQFIRKGAYNKLNDAKKEMYLQSTRDLISSFYKLDFAATKSNMKKGKKRIRFIDIKHDHVFSEDDDVKLKDYKDGIKVQVKMGKKWKHVAVVHKKDVKWLRDVAAFDSLQLKWIDGDEKHASYDVTVE
jgi:hypothetical protein